MPLTGPISAHEAPFSLRDSGLSTSIVDNVWTLCACSPSIPARCVHKLWTAPPLPAPFQKHAGQRSAVGYIYTMTRWTTADIHRSVGGTQPYLQVNRMCPEGELCACYARISPSCPHLPTLGVEKCGQGVENVPSVTHIHQLHDPTTAPLHTKSPPPDESVRLLRGRTWWAPSGAHRCCCLS